MMNKYGEYLKTLIYYDGPQLALLGAGKFGLLALNVPELSDLGFFCVTLKKIEQEKYFSNQVDLRYVFTSVKNSLYFTAKLDRKKNKYRLTKFTDRILENYLPERGLFASDHTSDYNPLTFSSQQEKFLLDGSWELQEFGRFQQLLAEVYSFCGALFELSSGMLNAKLEAAFSHALNDVPYEGGGSYLSLFRNVKKSVKDEDALRLVSIVKASPGEMILAGKGDYFKETEKHIECYAENARKIEDSYLTLYRFLKSANLLRFDVDKFPSSSPLGPEILNLSEHLLTLHEFSHTGELVSYCQDNSLKVAKVALAFHRRVAGTAAFFDQGRVQFC